MSITCQHCSTELSDMSSFNRHQRYSKYCLQIQKKDNLSIFNCEFCSKKLSSKFRLQCHLDICKLKSRQQKDDKSELLEMKEKMKSMEKEVERLKEKPSSITINTTTNNNYGSILNCLTQEAVQETFKNFSMKDLLASDSQKTLANLTIKNCLSGPDQPMYFCKDRSRNKFVFTDEENKETEDPNALMLRTLIYKGVKPVIKELYAEQLVYLHSELARCLRKDDASSISNSHGEIKELKNAYAQVNILKNGENYISQLSKCLPSSIKDRLIKDRVVDEVEVEDDDSDEESERQLQLQIRKIGEYTASELTQWKKLYTDTGIIKGPKEMWENPRYAKQFTDFLKEK